MGNGKSAGRGMKSSSPSTPHCSSKAGEIYKFAARNVELQKESFACIAVGTAATCFGRLYDGEERQIFEELFSPESTDERDLRPLANGWYGPWHDDEARNARVLALCFMAAMVEAGDA